MGSNQDSKELEAGLYAELDSSQGKMIFLLDYERTPLLVSNFSGLAEGTLVNDFRMLGEPYYDGMTFYRDAKDYVIFSGDPLEDGTGGPGYTLPRETGALISTGSPGVLVMDGSPTESSGSRFFITKNGDSFLDKKYSAFGRLVRGSQVLKKIKQGDLLKSVKIIRVGPSARRLRFTPELFNTHYHKARLAEIENLRVYLPALADAVLELGEERKKTASGIYYQVLIPSEKEKKPIRGSSVSIHYVGTLLDGSVFDDSRSRNQTFDFVLGKDGVIPGWIEMVLDMRQGEQRKIIIPPYLAYGESGYGPIESDSWLIFDLELIDYANE